MALSDVSQQDVLQAIKEYRDIGQERFLAAYRFRSGKYWLIHEGSRYESTAILGVAHDKFACKRVRSTDYITKWKLSPGRGRFSGGQQTRKTLEGLGFMVRVDRQ